MSRILGSASINIVPNMDDAKLQADLDRIAKKKIDIGAKLGLDDKAAQGELGGFRAEADKAVKNMPAAKLSIDSRDAIGKLAEFRLKADEAIRRIPEGELKLDDRKALSTALSFRAKIDAELKRAGVVDIDVRTDKALAKIAKFDVEANALLDKVDDKKGGLFSDTSRGVSGLLTSIPLLGGVIGGLGSAFSAMGQLASSAFSGASEAGEEAGKAGEEAGAGIASIGPAAAIVLPIVAAGIAAIAVEATGLLAGFTAAGIGAGAFALLAIKPIQAVVKNLGDTRSQVEKLPGPLGGAVSAVQGLEGAWSKMSSAFSPIVFRLIDKAVGDLAHLLPDVVPFASTFASVMGKVLGDIGHAEVSPSFKDFLTALHKIEGPALQAIATGFGHILQNVGKLLTVMSAADVVDTLNIAFSILDGTVIAITKTVQGTILGWGKLVNFFTQTVPHAFGITENALVSFGHSVESDTDEVTSHVSNVWNGMMTNIKNWSQDGWRDVTTVFDKGRHDVAASVDAVGSAISGVFTRDIPGFFAAGWHAFQSDFISPVEAGVNDVTSFFSRNLVAPVSGFFTRDIPGFFAAGWHGYQNDFISPVEGGVNDVTSFFSRNLVAPVSGFFTRDLPAAFSSAYHGYQNDFLSPVEGGVNDVTGFISHNLVSPISNFFGSAIPGAFSSAYHGFLNDFANPIKNAASGVISFFAGTVVGGFKTFFGDVEGAFKGAVSAISGIWNALKNDVEAPVNFVLGVVNKVDGFLNKIPGVSLPTGLHLATGGIVPGGVHGVDSVHAMLAPGELIIPSSHAAAFSDMARRASVPGFADGGVVPGTPAAAQQNTNQLNAKTQANAQSGPQTTVLGDIGSDLLSLLSKGAAAVVGPLLNSLVSDIPGDGLAKDIVTGMAKATVNGLKNAISGAASQQSSGGIGGAFGGGSASLLTIAKYLMANGFNRGAAAGIAATIGGESVPPGNPESRNCVPLTYKVVTNRGILSHDEVQIGDTTPVYSVRQGRVVEAVIVDVPYHNMAKICRIGNAEWSVVCTWDHKWITTDDELVRADEITPGTKIVLGLGWSEPIEFFHDLGRDNTFCLTTSTGTWTTISDEDERPIWTGNSGGWGLIGWTGNTVGLPSGYNGPTGNIQFDLGKQLQGVVGYANARGGKGPLNAAGNISAIAAGDVWSRYEAPQVPLSDTRPAFANQLFAELGNATPAATAKAVQTQKQVTAKVNQVTPFASGGVAGGKILALGASTTQGVGATKGHNYTSDLARMLGGGFSLENAGISGNELTQNSKNGIAGVTRFKDLLKGVKAAVIWEGNNDISAGVSAAKIIKDYQRMISEAHEDGVKVIGATLQPAGFSGKKAAIQEAVNKWIMSSHTGFDSVANINGALADKSDPSKMASWVYNKGQKHGEHPGNAGYLEMAKLVNNALGSVLSSGKGKGKSKPASLWDVSLSTLRHQFDKGDLDAHQKHLWHLMHEGTKYGSAMPSHGGRRPHSAGGVISEPVYGYGASSGIPYSFAENGPEYVSPSQDTGDNDVMPGATNVGQQQLIRLTQQLVQLLQQQPAAIARVQQGGLNAGMRRGAFAVGGLWLRESRPSLINRASSSPKRSALKRVKFG